MSASIACFKADLDVHGDVILQLLRGYAQDPMGGNEDLSGYAQANLINEMRKRPDSVVTFLCYVDGVPAGLCNCVIGFSTFACKSLLNIHDFYTVAEYRRKGVARALMNTVEDYSKEQKYCKITLECLANNAPAMNAYVKQGYKPYELSPAMGTATFFQKYL